MTGSRFDLFDFQQEAVDKLSRQRSRLLGDDMGLGKTIQAIRIDEKNRDESPGPRKKTLIVAPKSTLDDAWVKALRRETTCPIYSVGKNKADRDRFEAAASDGRKPGYFVCNWEALRLMPGLKKVDWFHIIADEVHRAKNRKAQQTQALKMLRTEYKTGLSGTWADNQPQDAWSVLNWLWPSYYTSYWNFVKHYCIVEQAPGGYMKVTGVKNAASLNNEMAPWYVRRTKQEVLKDLPDKYATDIWVDLSPTQRKAYNQMKQELIAWVGAQDQERPLIAPVVIAQLTRLQQFAIGSAEVTGYVEKKTKPKDGSEPQTYIAPVVRMTEPSSKLDSLMEILEDAPTTESIVVFSQFKQAIKLLEVRCKKAGITIATLTGDTKQQDRGRLIDAFQAGKVQVFAGTIAAGGVGITLTRASTVVFLDRAWSPSMNRQAEDRLHRIGQKNAVHVIDIMARSTIDLGRRTQIDTKWSWLKQILGDK